MGGGICLGFAQWGEVVTGVSGQGGVSMWLFSPPPGVLTVGFEWFVGLSGLPGMWPQRWAHTTHQLER